MGGYEDAQTLLFFSPLTDKKVVVEKGNEEKEGKLIYNLYIS